jgi:hypothetical protein
VRSLIDSSCHLPELKLGMVSAKLVLNPNSPMSIQEIMTELFYNNEKPLELLRKHDLEELFDRSIQVIKAEIQKKPIDFGKFRDIASNVLVTVNSKLREISDPLEKGYLELILKEIADYLLSKVTTSFTDSGRLISEIRSALETTSSLKGYDFEALVALLRLNSSSKYLSSRLSGTFYYEWKGKQSDLSDLIETLKSSGWITSVKNFRKLFVAHGDPSLNIEFSRTKRNDLIALFDVLKAQGLITPKGCKGHFYPLKRYLVDLEGKRLFETDPKTLKMLAKRNQKKWEGIVKNVKSLVDGYMLRQGLRLP